MKRNRREFLEHVGTGMIVTGIGAGFAGDIGISTVFAGEGENTLDFGDLRPLVGLIQETPPDKLQPKLVKKLQDGKTDLRQLIAAAALANAETFGGQDYVGYHTEMALIPALQMSAELPSERQPLPVLKVMYRNAGRIQESGRSKKKALRPVAPADLAGKSPNGNLIRKATRGENINQGERILAASVEKSRKAAFNHVMWAVQDAANVHRFVLAYRSWGLIDIVGAEHAHTMLRQCVRYCVDEEKHVHDSPIRKHLAKCLDQYQLLDRKLGDQRAEDGWLEEFSQFMVNNSAERSMDAIAGALAEGISPDSIGEALSMAANKLVLTQGRLSNGSWRAHGATAGVHGSDAVNAWRNMIKVVSPRNVMTGLLVSGYHVGKSKNHEKVEFYPHAEHLAEIKTTDPKSLLAEAENAIRENDQGRAAAAIQLYGDAGHSPRPVFDLMLQYAVSEDGRLHAEKYYQTVTEEFATTRPAFRWRQLVALARVTASAYGFDVKDRTGHRAPGYEQACHALSVEA